jgi:hypothetical protein
MAAMDAARANGKEWDMNNFLKKDGNQPPPDTGQASGDYWAGRRAICQSLPPEKNPGLVQPW